MRNFIEITLQNVLNDLIRTVEDTGALCACKGLTYEGGKSPDYTDIQVQQIYMLRYFPAYLVEYYLMYRKMINSGFLPEQLNVLSIGCGCGIDFWGLKFALAANGENPAARINYTGVDLAPWGYRSNLGLPTVQFLEQDITTWERFDHADYNVFVFPKCIGEFTEEVFERICDIFNTSHFEQHHVCGFCSLMNAGLAKDVDRFERIARIMVDVHGFECLDEMDQHWSIPGRVGLRTLCNEFIYPQNILDQTKRLISLCPIYIVNDEPCYADCKEKLSRWPILNSQYIKYSFLRFQQR